MSETIMPTPEAGARVRVFEFTAEPGPDVTPRYATVARVVSTCRFVVQFEDNSETRVVVRDDARFRLWGIVSSTVLPEVVA